MQLKIVAEIKRKEYNIMSTLEKNIIGGNLDE